LQERVGSPTGASNGSANPCDHLRHFKRLHQVIIRATIEPAQTVVQRASGGEKKNGSGISCGTQLTQNLEAVGGGHHHIEHQSIILPLQGIKKPILPVRRRVNRKSFFPQILGHRFAQEFAVFDDYLNQ